MRSSVATAELRAPPHCKPPALHHAGVACSPAFIWGDNVATADAAVVHMERCTRGVVVVVVVVVVWGGDPEVLG